MLSENIKTLRKQKGYSQEQLADKLNVVRQTVSKWEKGYSVPDADLLEDMAEIFEVDVGELLGKEILNENETVDIGELVKQLTILNEYLAERVRKRKKAKAILKKTLCVVFAAALLLCMYLGIGTLVSQRYEIFRDDQEITVTCHLENEQYNIKIGVWKDNNEIHSVAYPNNISQEIKNYSLFELTPEEAVKKIEAFFVENGGSCQIKYENLKPVDKIIELIKTEIYLYI